MKIELLVPANKSLTDYLCQIFSSNHHSLQPLPWIHWQKLYVFEELRRCLFLFNKKKILINIPGSLLSQVKIYIVTMEFFNHIAQKYT
jgi:hypothetical protein